MPLPLTGDQRPRLLSLPDGIASTAAGEDTAELCASSRLVLDDWQRFIIVNAMAETERATWAAFEVLEIISRQNGKNQTVLGREIGGLFIQHEELIIHTAHKFNASAEHYRKVRDLIRANPDLHRRVKRNGYKESHGSEGIELRPTPTLILGSGSKLVRKSVAPRLLFLARSGGSGRSFSCDCLIWDEVMYLSESEQGDAMPTLAARPNPQIWYLGSAGHQQSVIQGRVRRRGMRAIEAARATGKQVGVSPRLMFAEWSIDHCTEDCRPGCRKHDDPHEPRSHAKANPGAGIRISFDYIQAEMASMAPNGVRVWPPDQFARERLGVGDYPSDEEGWLVISEETWRRCQDAASALPEPGIAIAADATPDQRSAAIGIAGARKDGRTVIEVPLGDDGLPDHRAGMTWVVPRLGELKAKHKVCAIVIDPRSPAGSLIDEAEKAGLEIVAISTVEVAQAFAQFRTKAESRPVPQLVHLGQDILRSAVAGAEKRMIGDGAHAWARKSTEVDISPLVAVTNAAWAHGKFGRRIYDPLKSVAGPS